jgi:hypothetical protein
MSSKQQLPDLEGARQGGEAFGREIGNRVASNMTRAHLTHAEARRIGSEGVSTILAKASALADAGHDRELVAAWTDAAADAFNLALERAAALLNVPEGSTSKH